MFEELDPSRAEFERWADHQGISLWAEGGEFSLPGSTWLAVLQVARLYGWDPRGTNPSDSSVFEFDGLGRDGSYFPPAGQSVTAGDARALADALERALLDVPDNLGTSSESHPYAGWHGASASVMQRLGAIKPILRDLIHHCRDGGELWLC